MTGPQLATVTSSELRIRPGDSVVYRGQQYTCEAIEPYTRRDGRPTTLAVVVSHCKRCGEPFTMTVSAVAGRPSTFNRRGRQHATRRPR